MNLNKLKLINDASNLRKLILENPEMPVVVMMDAEICGDCTGYWLANTVYAEKDVIFELEAPWDDERTYTDESEFQEDLESWLWDNWESKDNEDPTEAEFEKVLQEKMKYYEQFWKDVIIVRCTN